MVSDLPDYTQYVVPAPRQLIELALPPESGVQQGVNARANLFFGVDKKTSNNLVTDYLKQQCIVPPFVTVASPCGVMVSYEGGYMCRALIYKAGAGEVALAKSCLDEWAALQESDGSWYQQYYPYLNVAGSHTRVAEISPGVSGDLKVDSGAALLAWAMADYDASVGPGSTVYQTQVKLALQWLRDAQYQMLVAGHPPLICNMKFEDTWDPVALAADCAEVLLAAKACLDQYGAGLTTSGGYSVRTLADDLYDAMATYLWTGDAGRYYYTGYPLEAQPAIPFTYKQKISYAQALCARAIYTWATSGYLISPDYSAQAEKALDFITTITAGQWGGYLYVPYTGAADETRNEFSAYTAHVAEAMNVVNASKYADHITRCRNFIKWLALSDGRVYDYAMKSGELWVGEVALASGVTAESYGFIALTSALGLLAGA